MECRLLNRRLSVTRFSVACLSIVALAAAPALASETTPLPANITFVTSTGYWEDSGDPAGVTAPPTDPGTAASEKSQTAGANTGTATSLRRGYYKLIAERQADGTAHVHLQQIALEQDGPVIVSSAELDEFSRVPVYVTDIRPESSTGVTTQPGLFATVYLKTAPDAAEPESWTVLIDEIGDIKVERATN